MPQREMEQRNIRKLGKAAGGKAFAVTLPVEFIRKLKWKEKQKLKMKLKGKSIIIRDWKQRVNAP